MQEPHIDSEYAAALGVGSMGTIPEVEFEN